MNKVILVNHISPSVLALAFARLDKGDTGVVVVNSEVNVESMRSRIPKLVIEPIKVSKPFQERGVIPPKYNHKRRH